MRAIRRVAALTAGLVGVLLATQAWLVLTAAPVEPLRADATLPDVARAPVDEHHALAVEFAPWILHEMHHENGRMDIPTAMDFDGDMDGTNAWESFPRHELLPTVYYTAVESATHWFVSYHLYHPRDRATIELGVQDTHEGDGENIQVVVEKANRSAVLLTTQAHYKAYSYAPQPGPIMSGRQTLRADFEVQLGHPVVYVETGGHGIYGSHDPRAANRLARVGEPVLAFRPLAEGESLAEPRPPFGDVSCTATVEECGGGEKPYRLVSLAAFLSNRTDHEALFADVGDFEGEPVPRYHRGDRYSGPLGPSRGISPFALGYAFDDGELGALFWDPARVYGEDLAIRGNWSRELLGHPFAS